jgi:DNA-binding HxlR family transcriptional regulator
VSRRAYGQYCGLARAVELVGERWALLIIRDLLVGPRRFTDLRRGLPRIPTNILAARLKEFEEVGLVRRQVLPRPDGSVVYTLTERGADLEPAIQALGRWGARSLGDPRPDEIVTVDSLVMALRTTFQADAAAGPRVSYELRMGDIVIHACIDDGRLEVAQGPLTQPDLVIETGPALKALMAAEISPTEAIQTGSVALTGPPELLARFVAIFRI